MNKEDEREAGSEQEGGPCEELRQELRDARALLGFAFSEGCAVDDHILQEISEAERDLLAPGPVKAERRIVFEKAYRDLTRLLSPVTAAVVRAQPGREWWAYWLGVGSCALLIGIVFHLLAHFTMSGKLLSDRTFVNINCGALGLLFFLLILWARNLFTDVVTQAIMSQITLFCYLFTVVFLLSPGLLLFFPPDPGTSLGGVMQESPIGIILGCLKQPDDQNGSEGPGPKDLFCRSQTEDGQWLIRIGGGMPGWQASGATEPQRQDSVLLAGATGNGRGLGPPRQITGGVVIPLYVVVFALWGGAVNMLRRVPEYQWRGLDVKDSLTREQAREQLIFQMTQILAAPLIAITSYYVLEPSTHKASVALGFVSGFASHPILLAIRAVTDTLTPARLVPLPSDPRLHPGESRGRATLSQLPPKAGE